MTVSSRKFVLACGCASLVLAFASAAIAQQRSFDIPAQEAASAIAQYGLQAGVQITAPTDALKGVRTAPLKGSMDARAALQDLLKGTGLVVARDDGRTVVLQMGPQGEAAAETARVVDEVIVTGSNLRGAPPTSPLQTITRADIERSGFSQVGDLIRSLPSNFNGGQNPGGGFVTYRDNADNQNVTAASSINLRGLGSGATLVLVNGKRMTGDSMFSAPDISGVPLNAMERIDIVPDGASAIYGADAVAGVVNMVLRKDYNGAQTSVRMGGATRGGGAEQTYGGLIGRSDERGYALASLEYSQQEPIMASQRDFASGMGVNHSLMEGQKRTSGYFTLGHRWERAELSLDGLLSRRDSKRGYQSGSYISNTYTRNHRYNFGASAKIRLPKDWEARADAVVAETTNRYEQRGGSTYLGIYEQDMRYAEVVLNGDLLRLPGGALSTAFGGGYREEGYSFVSRLSGRYQGTDRNLVYAFAEARAPLLAPSNDRKGAHELELNLSVRAEDYSDFGSTTNPKIGLRWVPADGVTVRTSWGTSYRAPSLEQMSSPVYATAYNASSLRFPFSGYAIMIDGSGHDLGPETSKSWSLGADFSPKARPTLKLSINGFDIRYKDKVGNPLVGVFSPGPLTDPYILYAPTQAQIQAALANAVFSNFAGAGYSSAQITAIVDNRLVNLASQTARGVDVSIEDVFDLGDSTLLPQLNLTMLEMKRQLSPVQPVTTQTGRIANPAKFRARGGLTWLKGPFSSTATVNYISGLTDAYSTPPRRVGSWTTVDAVLAYRLNAGASDETAISLSASNLFDRDPPYAGSFSLALPGLTYDAANHSPVGRFVAVSIRKSW